MGTIRDGYLPKDYWGGVDPLDPGAPPPSGTTDPGVTGNGNGVRQWALGAWYPGNYPRTVHFHQDRLCLAGAPAEPQRIVMSDSGAYELMSPSALLDDSVNGANSCSFTLNSNGVNAILWMQTDQNGLVCGTAGGEWVVDSASTTEPISPTSISAKQTSEFGAAPIPPLHVGASTLYFQTGARKLRDLKYNFAIDGFEGGDLSPLADHLTYGGFAGMCLQHTPYQIIWAWRKDGTLVSISYDAEQNEVAWCAHTMGGASDAAGTPAKILSATVIPTPDGTRDEVWLAVQRYINGATVVNIERMSKLWEVGDVVQDTSFAPTLPRYVPANTIYVDAGARLLSGTAVTTVTGLTWLKGETVSVVADGASHPDCVVDSDGAITLARAAKDVVVGLNAPSILRTLPIEAGGADGPAQGKIKRIHRVISQVYESAGFTVRDPTTGLTHDVSTRSTDDPMDAPSPLVTENIETAWEGTYDRDGMVELQQNQPLPLNVAGLIIQLETQDGG